MKHPLLTGSVLTVGILNLALFGLWLSMIKIDAVPDKMPEYVYNGLTLNFTILQITLGIVAFGTAFAAFFGYQSIKEGAMKRAEDTAAKFLKEEGARLVNDELNKRSIFNVAPAQMPSADVLKDTSNTKESERL